jgi:hypothetical protein
MKNIDSAIKALETAKEKCSEFLNADGYFNPILQHLSSIKEAIDEDDIFDGLSADEIEIKKREIKDSETKQLLEESAELFRKRKVRNLPVIEPESETFKEEVKPIEPPIVEPVVEPTNQPVVEPTAKPVVELTNEPIVEPIAKPVVEPIAKPVVEPTAKPVVELKEKAKKATKSKAKAKIETT